jgi:hypothetical protein
LPLTIENRGGGEFRGGTGTWGVAVEIGEEKWLGLSEQVPDVF